MAKITQKEQRLRQQIKQLRADKKVYFEEMIARGKEVTQMIRIFNMVRSRLPFGAESQIEKIAKGYALRNDKDRGSVYCPGEIDFYEGGIRGINKAKKEERFNDIVHKLNL